jgi:hypothetical protein
MLMLCFYDLKYNGFPLSLGAFIAEFTFGELLGELFDGFFGGFV